MEPPVSEKDLSPSYVKQHKTGWNLDSESGFEMKKKQKEIDIRSNWGAGGMEEKSSGVAG